MNFYEPFPSAPHIVALRRLSEGNPDLLWLHWINKVRSKKDGDIQRRLTVHFYLLTIHVSLPRDDHSSRIGSVGMYGHGIFTRSNTPENRELD